MFIGKDCDGRTVIDSESRQILEVLMYGDRLYLSNGVSMTPANPEENLQLYNGNREVGQFDPYYLPKDLDHEYRDPIFAV